MATAPCSDSEISEIYYKKIQQEGIEDYSVNRLEYFDVLMIGKAGSGKSTTADKLLIANPQGLCYGDSHEASTLDEDESMMHNQDLSMWIFKNETGDNHEEADRRLKGLAMHRQLQDSHAEVVRAHDDDDTGTEQCELTSNETTKLRVLDMPGFNSAFLLSIPASNTSPPPSASGFGTINLAVANQGLMQKLIRIQAIAELRFSRILYFLPNRGCLGKRPDADFIQQLELMAYFFGPKIFDSMIAVATLDGRRSKPDDFTAEDTELTKEAIGVALKKAFPNAENPPNPPPVLYISLQDTCEEIYDKIHRTTTSNDKLTLQFVENVCTKCSIKIGTFGESRVVCAFGTDLTQSLPYDESKCHPIMIPKWSRAWRFLGRIGNLFAGRKKYNWVSDVVCPNCRSDKNPCMRVGDPYNYKRNSIQVDHSTDLHYIAVAEDEANIA